MRFLPLIRRLVFWPSMSPPSISSYYLSSRSPVPPLHALSETNDNLTLDYSAIPRGSTLTLAHSDCGTSTALPKQTALLRCYSCSGCEYKGSCCQRRFLHGCTEDGWSQPCTSSFGVLHNCSGNRLSRASRQAHFAHGGADDNGEAVNSIPYKGDAVNMTPSVEIRGDNSAGEENGAEEEGQGVKSVIGRSKGTPAKADDMKVADNESCSDAHLSKDSSIPKKSMAIRSVVERRRGLFSRHSQGRIPDLLTVPGIGPRNMEKLVAKGIGGLAELKQLYLDKFRSVGKDKMIEYLQTSVGIIHKHHAISITTYIRDTAESELKSEESTSFDVAAKKRLTFCVEGNISVGKTTFLHRVTNEAIELRDLVEIVPEPVAKWQDVGPEHFNVLDAFYSEPQRYAYTFQNYVFITRLMQEQESARGVKPLRIMERSVFSDRMVFVRAVHEAKWMNEMEISIYDSWFDPVVSVLPGLVPDAFIYLRASPDTCHRRLQMRKRPEEQGVTLDYLRGLHEKHEQWLFPARGNKEGVFSVMRPSQLVEPLPPTLQDRVYYLEGEHVHSSLLKVPALILDCEANIDFSRDLEAKALYARQVSEFFEYVKRTKSAEPKAEAPQNMISNGLLFPRPGGLFMPDSSIIQRSLKSLHHQAPRV